MSVADAKAALRVETSDDDDLIGIYVAAAIAYVEQRCGIRLAAQTVTLGAWALCDRTFHLPIAPVTAVNAIGYIDNDGGAQTLDPAVYDVAIYGLTPTVSLAWNQNWPAHREGLGYITIEVDCGFGDGNCPKPIIQAINLLVGDWYANRETNVDMRVGAIPMVAIDALLADFRRTYV